MIRTDRWGALVEHVLTNYRGRIAGHNLLGFDEHVLRSSGFSPLPADIDDTLMMSKIIDSSRFSHGLKDLAEVYLGEDATGPARRLDEAMRAHGYKTKGDVLGQLDVDSDVYLEYSAGDTVLVAKLLPLMRKELISWETQYLNEMAAWRVVSSMEGRGVHVDAEWAAQMQEEFRVSIAALSGQIRVFGINKPGSTKQRIEVLLQDGWEPEEFTETGQAKLDHKVMEGLDFAVVPLLMEYTKRRKWLASYIEPVLNNTGGLVFPRCNPFGAITGRMSVSGPPLQQIPSHDSDAWKMRRMFLARPGEVLYGMDYDGQENRLLASFSGDKILTDMILNGGDMHKYAASFAFTKEESEITDEERGIGKTLNYALQYGAGIKKTAKILSSSFEEAASVRERLKEMFPEASVWKQEIENQGREHFYETGVAYVDTFTGRRVYIRIPKFKNEPPYYTLVNMCVQGSGADVLKIALNRIAAAGLAEYLYMNIHDEVQVSVPPDREDIAIEIQRQMEFITEFSVPLTVGFSGPHEYWKK